MCKLFYTLCKGPDYENIRPAYRDCNCKHFVDEPLYCAAVSNAFSQKKPLRQKAASRTTTLDADSIHGAFQRLRRLRHRHGRRPPLPGPHPLSITRRLQACGIRREWYRGVLPVPHGPLQENEDQRELDAFAVEGEE